MSGSLLRRILSPVAQVRQGEEHTVLLMFAYSVLAMTAYNIVQPIVRSRFISALGSDNLPYVLLASVFIVGLLMQGYSKLGGLLPGRWVIPATQAGMAVLLVLFWALSASGNQWVEVAFYLFGQIYGLLLISQFWTLANIIYDPREAKRLFGFIGAGASLGGIIGGAITVSLAKSLGNRSLMLVSAAVLAACAVVVAVIAGSKKNVELAGLEKAGKEEGVESSEAFQMLRRSKHLQIISILIALTSVGAGLIDQQFNMAAEAFKGRGETDSMTVVLAQVQVYMSVIGFVIQVFLTSRIHRLLGVGFALLILPVGLGLTGAVILLNAALWAPMFARVLDKSLRYTVDKTSREVLFIPLPAEIKHKAKPFVDVTVDRVGRAASAFLLLVLIKPWGLHLSWQQISWASFVVMGLWIAMALRAKKGYMQSFRRSMERGDVEAAGLRSAVADLSTIEALVEELANPDATRVLYAIDLLESFEKRNLITPLLLRHESPEVRIRALGALSGMRPEIAARWSASVERLLKDESPDVRAAAVRVLAVIHKEAVGTLMRPYLHDLDPRVVVTAAMALADSGSPADEDAAEEALRTLGADTRQSSAAARREVAGIIAQVSNPRFRPLLLPLFYDADVDVARAAIHGAERIGLADNMFVPSLVALLHHRLLKRQARAVLVGYGDEVIDVLAYFLRDQEEDIWVRRHIPGTLALMPSQKSMDLLASMLGDPDGFLRFKVVSAIEKLHRSHPELTFALEPIEALALKEGLRYFNYLSLRHNLFRDPAAARESLLARSLTEKLERTQDRLYRLLALVYPWKDIEAARWALENGDARARSGAAEFLDNLLTGNLRKRVLAVLEELPIEEKVRKGNVLLRSRQRNEEETLLQLVHDDDQVVSAAAIHCVEERKLWKLAGDLEYTLEHRDLKDWYVFEAASWALAAYRMPPDKRRELWLEPLPAVELANRLRRIPLFDFVSVDELFRIGGLGRQVRYETGQVLYHKHTPAATLQFLLDGKVAVERDAAPAATREDSESSNAGARASGGGPPRAVIDGSREESESASAGARASGGGPPRAVNKDDTHEVVAPAALAFDEVLEGRPCAGDSRAVDRSICLALGSDEFFALLSDNTVIAQGLFRMLLARGASAAWSGVIRGPEAASLPAAGATLTAIQKMVILQAIPVFARASGDELMGLSHITRQVPLGAAGSKLFGEADAAAMYTVLSGELLLESPQGGAATRVRPGETIGVFETLVGAAAGVRASVAAPGAVLRIEREDLFDQLTDHVDLLQGIFSALLRAESPAVPAGRSGQA